MTLFFNIEKVSKTAKNSPVKILQVLKDMNDRNPITKYYNLLSGNSFLLNPVALFNNKTTDIMYIYQYVLLASKRDYAHYKLFGVKSLPLSYYPDIKLDSIRTNPLLNVTNTEIIFKYEE